MLRFFKEKTNRGREIVAFLMLAVIVIFNAMDIINLLFLEAFLEGLFYVFSLASIVGMFALLLVLIQRYLKEKKIYLQASDLWTFLKFGIIALAISSGSLLSVCAILLYEKLHDGSNPIFEKGPEGEEQAIYYYAIRPLMFFLLVVAVEYFAIMSGLKIAQYLYYNGFVSYEIARTLISLPFWLSSLGLLMFGSYFTSGSVKPLFSIKEENNTPLDEKKEAGGGKFSSLFRNFSWMLIGFLIASPTIFLPILIYGWPACSIMLLELFSSSQYVMYVLVEVLFYCIQPLVEEIIFRSLLFKYCVNEGLCQKDYTKMSWFEKIAYSLLNGSLFAIAHQAVRGYVSVVNFVPLFVFGFLTSMLTFLSGSICLSTFEHAFHNLACTLCPTFLIFWFVEGYEYTRFITPFTSSIAKYCTVLGLESAYLYIRSFFVKKMPEVKTVGANSLEKENCLPTSASTERPGDVKSGCGAFNHPLAA